MSSSVSVITTIYNAERFLDEAISSVVQQSHSDWQLILVDDGSQDTSVHLAAAWCKKDSRIVLIHHPGSQNRGISASRNLGISSSRGDLIAFLDADDVWLPGKLAAQVEILQAQPEAALTFGAAERWYSWNQAEPAQPDFIVPSAIPGWGADRLIPPPALVDAFLDDESLTPCTCSVLARRKAVMNAGAFESHFRGLYDDQVFYAKLGLSEAVYVSSDCVARYRQHDDSCCATARRLGTGAEERARFLSWLEEYQFTCARSR